MALLVYFSSSSIASTTTMGQQQDATATAMDLSMTGSIAATEYIRTIQWMPL